MDWPFACCRLVLTRYIQWMVTTPTLVYIVSKISDFTTARVATAVLTQISVILSGLIASVVPSPWKCESGLGLCAPQNPPDAPSTWPTCEALCCSHNVLPDM